MSEFMLKQIKKLFTFLILGIGISLFSNNPAQAQATFVRGDVNCDGAVDSLDLLFLQNCISICQSLPPCLEAADVNDDGLLFSVSDLTYLARHLESGEPLPPPFPNCGTDPTPDGLPCSTSCCACTLTTQCNDGIDNDGDGLIDLADPFCCNCSSFAEHFAYKPGDFNGNGVIGLPDIIGLVGHVFKGGPYPIPNCLGDVNGNGSLTLIDIIYLVNYIYKSGPEPVPSDICCFPSP